MSAVSFTDHAVNNTSQTAYTFSSRAIGSAATDRYVACLVASNGGAVLPSSVTIGGVAATLVASKTNILGSIVALYLAALASGATASVVVNFSSGPSRCGIGLWAVTGIASTTAFSSGSSTADPGTTTINVPPDGVAIGGAVGVSATFTWAGLTENYDESFSDGTQQTGAAAHFTSAQSGLTVTADQSASSVLDAFVAASFFVRATSAGASAGSSTAAAVGSGRRIAAGSASGVATASSPGAKGIDISVGTSVGAATVSGVGVPGTHPARGTSVGSSTAHAVPVFLQTISTVMVQKPVDYVMAGNQRDFKNGRAPFGALRGIFRE